MDRPDRRPIKLSVLELALNICVIHPGPALRGGMGVPSTSATNGNAQSFCSTCLVTIVSQYVIHELGFVLGYLRDLTGTRL